MKKAKTEQSKFTNMNIKELETHVETFVAFARSAHAEMVAVLLYLKTSGRYKENKTYERSTFYDYLSDRFGISKNAYMNMQRSYAKYPQETKELGSGIVCMALDICGPLKAKKALQKMIEINAKTKISRAKMLQIIRENAIPRIEKKNVDWRAMYEVEAAAHSETKNALRSAMAEINELQEQISRLK
jgi:hypothetical protein